MFVLQIGASAEFHKPPKHASIPLHLNLNTQRDTVPSHGPHPPAGPVQAHHCRALHHRRYVSRLDMLT
eukprot:1160189-Pelagomonas_calceolata.AAC.2